MISCPRPTHGEHIGVGNLNTAWGQRKEVRETEHLLFSVADFPGD